MAQLFPGESLALGSGKLSPESVPELVGRNRESFRFLKVSVGLRLDALYCRVRMAPRELPAYAGTEEWAGCLTAFAQPQSDRVAVLLPVDRHAASPVDSLYRDADETTSVVLGYVQPQ